MNRILLILLLPLSAIAQTTYPVLSTTTARTIVGGITNLPHLNSNNVFTGTGRWTGAVTLTNSGNVFAGDGSGLTGISAGVSTSGGSATNLSVYSSGTTNRPLRVFGGTQTNSNPIEYTATWNNSGVTFDGLKLNITDTASGSASRLMDLQVGGSSKFKVDKNGTIDYSSSPALTELIKIGAINIQHWSGDVYVTGGGLRVWNGEFITCEGAIGIIAGSYRLGIGNYASIGFSSSASYSGSTDAGLRRNAAGVVEVNTGTAGTYRDLITRSTYATNLYATNLVLNGGATVTGVLSATASLNFDLTAVTVEDKTMTITGAAVGDIVTLGVPNGSVTTSVQYTAWVSAADTVTVRARTSATGEDPASGTFRATVIKH